MAGSVPKTGRARLSRDLVLFVFGLSGIVFETLRTGTERPTLLIAFLACLGFPIFLRTDEIQTAKTDAAKEKETEAQAGDSDGS